MKNKLTTICLAIIFRVIFQPAWEGRANMLQAFFLYLVYIQIRKG